MKDFDSLLSDVLAGRREVVDFVRDFTTSELQVMFDDGEVVAVSAAEAKELSAARHGRGASDVSLDALFDSLK